MAGLASMVAGMFNVLVELEVEETDTVQGSH